MTEEAKQPATSNDPVPFEEHTKVMQSLQAERERSQKFEGQLVDFQKQLDKFSGVDLDKLKADSEALRLLQQEQASGNPEEVSRLVQEAEASTWDKASKEIQAREDKIKALSGQLHQLQVVDKTMSKIGSRFNDDMQDFIKGMITSAVDKDEQGNLIVKDKEGKIRYNSTGQVLTVEDYASELIERYPSAAKPKGVSGAKPKGVVAPAAGGVTLESYERMDSASRKALPIGVQRELAAQALKKRSQ